MSYYLQMMERFRTLLKIGYVIEFWMDSTFHEDGSRQKHVIKIESCAYYCRVEHVDLEEAAKQVLEHRDEWEKKVHAIQNEEARLSAVGSGDGASDTVERAIQAS